jgi:hypothetical protein
VLRHIRVASKQELEDRNWQPVVHTWAYKLDEAAFGNAALDEGFANAVGNSFRGRSRHDSRFGMIRAFEDEAGAEETVGAIWNLDKRATMTLRVRGNLSWNGAHNVGTLTNLGRLFFEPLSTGWHPANWWFCRSIRASNMGRRAPSPQIPSLQSALSLRLSVSRPPNGEKISNSEGPRFSLKNARERSVRLRSLSKGKMRGSVRVILAARAEPDSTIAGCLRPRVSLSGLSWPRGLPTIMNVFFAVL